MEAIVKSLDRPDELGELPKGHAEIVRLGDQLVIRGELEPGWRWSNDWQPIMGTASCRLPHTGVVLSGRTTVTSVQMRVLQLEQELASARSIYTEKHPEIQRLQEDLAAAKRDATAERERPETDRLQLDPAYRQLLADRETSRLRIRDLQRARVPAEFQRLTVL